MQYPKTQCLAALLCLLTATAHAAAPPDRESGDSVTIVVAYYSMTGNTAALAEAVAEGARGVARTRVVVGSVDEITADELRGADGIVVGSPTHWANVAARVQQFVTGWPVLVDKVGGAFATGGAPTGGREHVITSILLGMLNHGMVVVGPLFSDGERVLGSLGASAVTGPTDPGLSDAELDEARRLGARVAEMARRLRSSAANRTPD
jgi:NAD(P)H dehydrogenase (quinone)